METNSQIHPIIVIKDLHKAFGTNIVGEFNNLTQQMINFIFVELWKNYTDD